MLSVALCVTPLVVFVALFPPLRDWYFIVLWCHAYSLLPGIILIYMMCVPVSDKEQAPATAHV